MQPIRIARTPGEADEWALVLTAAGIPNAIEADALGWAVLAAADDSTRAHALLSAYESERRVEVAAPAAAPYPWMSGVALALLLLWLFSVTGTRAAGSPWFEPGAAMAGHIVAGEVWRTVTALTLHADLVHAAGNAVAVAVLAPPLVQRFGGGLTPLLLLAAGALGNALAALVHDPRHVAVGASTAAFGALGILTALRFVPGAAPSRGKRWTAAAAGVLLLAMLGTAPGADLTAHAFGFLTGAGLGIAAGMTVRNRPRTLLQWGLGTLAGGVVVLGWHAAGVIP
jgi:membrane associated rhomboid family serine protease